MIRAAGSVAACSEERCSEREREREREVCDPRPAGRIRRLVSWNARRRYAAAAGAWTGAYDLEPMDLSPARSYI